MSALSPTIDDVEYDSPKQLDFHFEASNVPRVAAELVSWGYDYLSCLFENLDEAERFCEHLNHFKGNRKRAWIEEV